MTLTLELIKFAALAIFIIVSLFFVIVTAILYYHWKRYILEDESFHRARMLYFGVSIVIFSGLVVFFSKIWYGVTP